MAVDMSAKVGGLGRRGERAGRWARLKDGSQAVSQMIGEATGKAVCRCSSGEAGILVDVWTGGTAPGNWTRPTTNVKYRMGD